MVIRPYRSSDCAELCRLFYETVHAVCGREYSPRELEAWAPEPPEPEAWDPTFLRHRTLVAEENGRILGFGDMDDAGYLDRLYVHKDHQGEGIATALCDTLENGCTARPFVTHASLTARGFFENRGYRVVRVQRVLRRGVKLSNFVMEKF